MWCRRLRKNKYVAVMLVALGAMSVPIEWDVTFLIFALVIGALLFFAKENLVN